MTNFRKTALALASAFMMAGAAGAAGLPDILERDAAGTSAAQKAGAELARLVDGKDDAEAARRMEEREAMLLAHYRDKLAASLSRLEASEAAIEAERESVRRMRMETGPLMDEMAASLAEVVAADRKFLSGERRARLENLRAVLADPTLTDGQKMDVLLDAWQVEASYGLTVGADRGVNDSGALAVFLRIGRLLHAEVSEDGRRARIETADGWRELSEKDAAMLAEAVKTASGAAAPDLMLVAESLLGEAVLASIERHEGLLTESVMKTQIGRSKAFMDDAPVSKTDGVARLRRHCVRALGAVAGSAGVRTVEDAVIYDAAGAPSRGTVTLYGPFAAKAGDGAWLRYLPSERAWRRLADDPGIPAGVVALDPSFGRLLAGYAERHSAWAWMKPAGVIGIFIGLVAAAALLLGFLRWTALALEERRVRRQLEDMENPREDNSLGRMLAAAKESTDELLEAKLDAAIVAERPGFERGVATLAVLAGIPTLLGLLGTVSGMIETFTVMSEYGSAEPGLLAGGIAEALVTTELGLVSAIPILLLHCAVKTKRDALFSHLEEAASTLAVREAAGCCGACRRDE